MNNENKMIIYQVFTRLFGNNNNHCVYNGDITANGCGKMADFTLKALGEIRKLGSTQFPDFSKCLEGEDRKSVV